MHGSKRQKIGRKRYPLRKIVSSRTNQYGCTINKLECGHEQAATKDLIGERDAVRRRCLECGKVQAAERAERT